MNHPEISILNARLYHAQKVREAEARRRARKAMGACPSLWRKIAGQFRPLVIQPKKTRAGDPAILESAN